MDVIYKSPLIGRVIERDPGKVTPRRLFRTQFVSAPSSLSLSLCLSLSLSVSLFTPSLSLSLSLPLSLSLSLFVLSARTGRNREWRQRHPSCPPKGWAKQSVGLEDVQCLSDVVTRDKSCIAIDL